MGSGRREALSRRGRGFEEGGDRAIPTPSPPPSPPPPVPPHPSPLPMLKPSARWEHRPAAALGPSHNAALGGAALPRRQAAACRQGRQAGRGCSPPLF